MSFEGFPSAALDFYDDLEVDNTKSFWEAHKTTYQSAVLEPMKALTKELEAEFGAAKIFRPYKDVRFSKDKTPYKTHQGAFVAVAPQTGYYVEVSPRGVRTGGGCYWFEPPRLAAFRQAIDHDRFGPELERLLRSAERRGYEVGGDRLKTKPRGFDADHPRIELLKHKSLTLGRMIGFEPVIHTPALLDLVRADWRATRPVTDWIGEHAAI
ncbi:MAG: DUF2461 domain-containing protein [Nocardioides sp.]|uniref:DUF2461 domain-containing protein n=1 Tax=Nocardioides sp. TaxID=35761 RepID=UPI0039E3C123